MLSDEGPEAREATPPLRQKGRAIPPRAEAPGLPGPISVKQGDKCPGHAQGSGEGTKKTTERPYYVLRPYENLREGR